MQLETLHSMLKRTPLKFLGRGAKGVCQCLDVEFDKDKLEELYKLAINTTPIETDYIFFSRLLHFGDDCETDTLNLLELSYIKDIYNTHGGSGKVFAIYENAYDATENCRYDDKNSVNTLRDFTKNNLEIKPKLLSDFSFAELLGTKLPLSTSASPRRNSMIIAQALLFAMWAQDLQSAPQNVREIFVNTEKTNGAIPEDFFAVPEVKTNKEQRKAQLRFNMAMCNFRDKYLELSFLMTTLENIGYLKFNPAEGMATERRKAVCESEEYTTRGTTG